jgi:transmembrane sensor
MSPPRHTAPQPSRDERLVRKEAVGWYARLCSGSASAADQLAWRRWHDQHPDHRHAWQRIESMRQTLQQVPAAIAMPSLRLAAGGPRRRQALRGVLLLASTGTLAYASYRYAEQRGLAAPLMADFRTGIGQQRRLTLADGSLLVLNTGSAADVRFSATERVVRLWSGEILIETAKHRQAPGADPRPFIVDSAHGRVTALGTRFTVRRFDGHTEVAVLDDAVELRAAAAPQRPVLLRAGQQASFNGERVDAPRAADGNAGQWQSGNLLVDDRSLAEVLAELSRYRRGHLGCDASVAGLRISGVFPLADTDRALALLAQTFPLRVRGLTRFWVTLGPR